MKFKIQDENSEVSVIEIVRGGAYVVGPDGESTVHSTNDVEVMLEASIANSLTIIAEKMTVGVDVIDSLGVWLKSSFTAKF